MTTPTKEWRKVLFEHQNFADNYVPSTFLKDLRKNVNIRYYSLKEIIINSGAITQEICSIVVFLVVFLLLDSGNHSTSVWVCVFISTTTLLLYVTLMVHSKHSNGAFRVANHHLISCFAAVLTELKSAFIFLFGGFTVSPILKTLTETISTDTIYTMVTLMMLLHLTFYDYGAKAAIVSKSIALNAAIFGAVCLASQLSTSYHAFALLIFASDVFVLFSALRHQIRENSSKLIQCIITILLAMSAFLSLYMITLPVYAFLLLFLLILVNLVFPYGFYYLQSYKENIYGPWDEAVIQTSSSFDDNLNTKKLN